MGFPVEGNRNNGPRNRGPFHFGFGFVSPSRSLGFFAAASPPAATQPNRVSSAPARVERAARRRARAERGRRSRSARGSGPDRRPPARITVPVHPFFAGSSAGAREDSNTTPTPVSTADA